MELPYTTPKIKNAEVLQMADLPIMNPTHAHMKMKDAMELMRAAHHRAFVQKKNLLNVFAPHMIGEQDLSQVEFAQTEVIQ
jgi:hypothetical protein